MLQSLLRILLGLLIGYGVLCVIVWRIQARLALPGGHTPLPPPSALGMSDGEIVTARTVDGVELHGWYLPPNPKPAGGAKAPGLIWFYGNGESVGAIAPILKALRPPGVGVLALDYRGYGTNAGTPSEAGLYRDAAAAWRWLVARSEIDTTRIGVYGRSVGSVPALYLATEYPARVLVLESPLTSARDMARVHYPFLPRFIITLSLDNLSRAARLTAPLLVLHGTEDEVAPIWMGRAVAEAGHAREFVMIKGAHHNETYDVGGAEYRTKLHAFLKTQL
jgi:hypothetical protein